MRGFSEFVTASSRAEPPKVPIGAIRGKDQPIVQSAGTALPEFDIIWFYLVASPEGRKWNVATLGPFFL